ncbi:MAG: ADP-glyceromanno-heptose 6-epimerase [Saprospirales bacterium]|nr:MAG: ADP-glyceromanno-heptose 6-epimerase [Saprospirales bacterium]
MIIVTGGAGFIGSCLIDHLFSRGAGPVVAVDDFSVEKKRGNWEQYPRLTRVERSGFFKWLERIRPDVDFVFHLGARTDTAERNKAIFQELNLNFSRNIWNWCSENNVPLVYASSAATYGDGSAGYSDAHENIQSYQPLNEYGWSKHRFDLYALEQLAHFPPNWYGLKFFNVYGPREYHKGRMASVVFHAYNQIRDHGGLKLFRSHRPEIADGMQMRDFIYVVDLLNIFDFLYVQRPQSGIYNVGTGNARSFLDLGNAVFSALGKEARIEFIDIPKDIRGTYQYHTQADVSKLRKAGYEKSFFSLEEGVADYVEKYLRSKFGA